MSTLMKTLLRASMESEGAVEASIDDPAVNVITDQASDDQAALIARECESEVTKADVTIDRLLDIAEGLESLMLGCEQFREKGLSEESAYLLNLSFEQLVKPIRHELPVQSAVSFEAFRATSPRQATSISMESIKETIKKVWEMIKAAIKKAETALKTFMQHALDRSVAVSKVIHTDLQKLADHDAEPPYPVIFGKSGDLLVEGHFRPDVIEKNLQTVVQVAECANAQLDSLFSELEKAGKGEANMLAFRVNFRTLMDGYPELKSDGSEPHASTGVMTGGIEFRLTWPSADSVVHDHSGSHMLNFFKGLRFQQVRHDHNEPSKLPALRSADKAAVERILEAIEQARTKIVESSRVMQETVQKLEREGDKFVTAVQNSGAGQMMRMDDQEVVKAIHAISTVAMNTRSKCIMFYLHLMFALQDYLASSLKKAA